MIKKLIGTAATTAFLLAAAAVPAFANGHDDGHTCKNAITGPFSWNKCKIREDTRQRVSLSQSAYVYNKVYSTVNAGDNDANYNTKVKKGIKTGDAEANVNILTAANEVNLKVRQSSDGSDGSSGKNFLTGPFSDNHVSISTNESQNVSLSQSGKVNNTVKTDVNTGGNQCNFNTICGGIKTGDAESNVTLTTLLNKADVKVTQ